ncbi:MAG: toll/interleukin-1 receptor domain-containing protein [Hyphomicrobiaceae bacterium]
MATVFLSYSHKDEHFRKQVAAHFGVIEKHHAVHVWTDRRLQGGDRWREEIKRVIGEADLVVLLVSQHALTSEFILNEEVEPALKAAKRVYPILVRDCDWQGVDWLAKLQVRPEGAVSLAALRPAQRDKALAAICREIRGLLGRPAA